MLYSKCILHNFLQISIKDPSVFGTYLCKVSNSLGEKERTITIVEGGKKAFIFYIFELNVHQDQL